MPTAHSEKIGLGRMGLGRAVVVIENAVCTRRYPSKALGVLDRRGGLVSFCCEDFGVGRDGRGLAKLCAIPGHPLDERRHELGLGAHLSGLTFLICVNF